MGCMLGKNDLMSAYREEQMPMQQALANSPRQESNGDTFIPINWTHGRYSNKYPVWLIDNVSPKKWSYIIDKLNDINSSSSVWKTNNMNKYKKLSKTDKIKYESLMEKNKQKLKKNLNNALSQINKKILNPRSLTAIFTFNYHSNDDNDDAEDNEIGIIIKHINIAKQPIDDSEGKFVILSCYDKENIGSNDDPLYETDEI